MENYESLMEKIHFYNVTANEEEGSVFIFMGLADQTLDCEVHLKRDGFVPYIDKLTIDNMHFESEELLDKILEKLSKEKVKKSLSSQIFNPYFLQKIKNFLLERMEKTVLEKTFIKYINTKFEKCSSSKNFNINMELDVSIEESRKKLCYKRCDDYFDIVENDKLLDLSWLQNVVFDLLDKDEVSFLIKNYSTEKGIESWYFLGDIITRKFKETKEYKMLCLYDNEFNTKYNNTTSFRFTY